LHSAYVSLLALAVLFLGVFWNPLAVASSFKGVNSFHAMPAKPAPPKTNVAQGAP
jgi:hypothetical protein